jgi:signal transduction histidine kinase
VAHDFNNLLSVVIGSLELLQRRVGQDPALARLVGNAMQAAHRGATLTQRMLAFARRQELKPQPIDMRRLVSDMTELLDRSLGPDITLNIRFPPPTRQRHRRRRPARDGHPQSRRQRARRNAGRRHAHHRAARRNPH